MIAFYNKDNLAELLQIKAEMADDPSLPPDLTSVCRSQAWTCRTAHQMTRSCFPRLDPPSPDSCAPLVSEALPPVTRRQPRGSCCRATEWGMIWRAL